MQLNGTFQPPSPTFVIPEIKASAIGIPGSTSMIGKRVQFHAETWQELRLLAFESMKSFQELADEAFRDLLRKHGRPASLKEALRRSAGESAKIIPLKRKPPRARNRKK
jgi:hypothetical protein